MTTDAFHPDHLKPGDRVGPWQIVESLGTGNCGHTFKVEREGVFFSMKMAVRPAPELPLATPEETLEERQVDGRMCHEGALLLANTSHPGLPHVREVGRWPHPIKGYLYIITDYVLGEPFHKWRKRTRPTVAQFVDVLIEVVRVVKGLHSRGIFIRDFKSEHVIVPEDHKPTLIDLGSAWLPGGSMLTVGLAPGTPHMLPPECITFIREGSWRQGARFDANPTGDLYQVGVFMYEALTECYPFDPHLPKEELLVAIENVVPRPPHRLNPEVPESLSRITLRLLEKQPEARYESAEALLQALWEANKERSTPPWKVSPRLPPEGPAPVTPDEVEERRALQQESERRVQEARKKREEARSREQAMEELSAAILEMSSDLDASDERAARRKKRWRRIALVVGLVLLGFTLLAAGWAWRSPSDWTVHTASEKGSLLVSTFTYSRPVRAVAAWLCATFAIGCPAAQVRPPDLGNCPQETRERMEEMGWFQTDLYEVTVDINQPGDGFELGVYHDGPLVGRVEKTKTKSPVGTSLPGGTLLYGQLWAEGIYEHGHAAVAIRYHEALLPDGRHVPICFFAGDRAGLITQARGSKPGAILVERRTEASVDLPVY